jgi:hypothetical protein
MESLLREHPVYISNRWKRHLLLADLLPVLNLPVVETRMNLRVIKEGASKE